MNEDISFLPKRDDYLIQIEKKAERENIPIIKAEVGQFLSVLIKAKKPLRILEIGTAVGYSTIWMAKAAQDAEIVTIERDEDMFLEAERNFYKLGLKTIVNQKYGDALEILPYLKRKFDFVFIDAAKGQYLNYLEMILELVPEGGIIAADNINYHGFVEQKGHILHKRRTMVRILQDYIRVVTDHPLLDSSILNLGDGMALSVRK